MALFLATVTAYHGPCRKCATVKLTATDTSALTPGAAINAKLAIPALRHARFVRAKLPSGWTVWLRVDDTGRGPKKKRLRRSWVDLRLCWTHIQVMAFGTHRYMVETR